ncbi:MAG: gliding motility-associated C-terminal domain-containing protein [Bacteroidia bacterium]
MIIFCRQAFAQVYGLSLSEFGLLSLADSSYTIITPDFTFSSTGSGNSTFDSKKDRYIYVKVGDWNDTIIFINAADGSLIRKTPIPRYSMNMPQCDPRTGLVYGLGQTEYGAFDLSSDTYISVSGGINWNDTGSGNSTFDADHNRFIFTKIGVSGINDTVIVLQADNGTILKKIPVPVYSMNMPQYDPKNNMVYGLGMYEFGATSLSDDSYTTISHEINWNNTGSGNSTYDFNNQRFIFQKIGNIYDTIVDFHAPTGSDIKKIPIIRYTMYLPQFNNDETDTNEIKSEVITPNVFTPNGDGINDLFSPVSEQNIHSIQLSIYNRWGKRIFFSEDAGIRWDGTDELKRSVPDGCYYWTVSYSNDKNHETTAAGFVTVLK